ncbi:MAG: hypothetical protein ACM3SV_06610 [Betaproteobacteria bacterium]
MALEIATRFPVAIEPSGQIRMIPVNPGARTEADNYITRSASSGMRSQLAI